MRRHAKSERLTGALARCEKHAVAWAGVVYRSVSIRYSNRDDLLTGAGSKSAGARWNPPESVAAVYTSHDIQTAVAEALAHHRYYGFAIETALPRVLVSIQVRLQRAEANRSEGTPHSQRHARPAPRRGLAGAQS